MCESVSAKIVATILLAGLSAFQAACVSSTFPRPLTAAQRVEVTAARFSATVGVEEYRGATGGEPAGHPLINPYVAAWSAPCSTHHATSRRTR